MFLFLGLVYAFLTTPFKFKAELLYDGLSNPGPVFIKLAEIKISLKSQVLVSNLRPFLVSEWVGIHEIFETKFGLRIGLKVKTGYC